MEANLKRSILDARTDERWVRSLEALVEREDWTQLWLMAQKTPPIWTVRILKLLAKRSWFPEADQQLDFFEHLSKYASACNEFDLPGPEVRPPMSLQLDVSAPRIAAARITGDGEFVFVLNEKATAIEIYRTADAGAVERIRLDMANGKQYAVLAFAIDSFGDRLAVLVYEPLSQRPFIHVYQLEEGEVVSDMWIAFNTSSIGTQVPRIAFDHAGKQLYLYTSKDTLSVWDADKGLMLQQFENTASSTTYDSIDGTYSVSDGANISDWRRYGRWAIGAVSSPGVFASRDGSTVVARRGSEAVVWKMPSQLYRHVESSGRQIELSLNGQFVAVLDDGSLYVADLSVDHGGVDGLQLRMNVKDAVVSTDSPQPLVEIATLRDPLARVAISEDSEIVAVSMSHANTVRLWHLPDGRSLGSLPQLAHDVLLDFRFASGGSVVAVTRTGLVQLWEADGNGNAWPWSPELIQITHQPVDASSVEVLRRAQEMRRRGWLSVQESNLLDLALTLMQHRLNLDIEIEWDNQLPADIYDIEIESDFEP